MSGLDPHDLAFLVRVGSQPGDLARRAGCTAATLVGIAARHGITLPPGWFGDAKRYDSEQRARGRSPGRPCPDVKARRYRTPARWQRQVDRVWHSRPAGGRDHGTLRGYVRHLNGRGEPCTACHAAHVEAARRAATAARRQQQGRAAA